MMALVPGAPDRRVSIPLSRLEPTMPSSHPIRSLLAVLLLATATPALDVLTVTPARNATAASTSASIEVLFDTLLDPATLDADSVQIYGRWSGPVPGTLSVVGGTRLVFRPSRPYFPGEMVLVTLTQDVSGLVSGALTGGHQYTFFTRSAQGNSVYALDEILPVRLPGDGFIQSYGLFAGDLDADGAPDFAVPNETSHDVRVLMNDGCTNFSLPDVNPLPLGSRPSSNEGQDFDRDGVVDFAVANINGNSMSVFIGHGDGSFQTPVTYPSGNNARGLATIDVEGDGDVDIVIAHRSASSIGLHLNNGDGTFAAVSSFNAGIAGETAVSAADADNDGHVDLLVAGYTSNEVSCMLNDGTGTFTVSDTSPTGGNPWMTAIGDLNDDGNIDMTTCNSSGDSASIIMGDGTGQLVTAASHPLGDFSLAIELGDIDGDGDIDLVSSSFNDNMWVCYRNDGAGNMGNSFELPATQTASCATLVDYDRDGFVDIVGVDEIADLIFLYRQDVPAISGVQSPRCNATLRIDNLANRAGFNGQPPHLVESGGYLFAGVTAQPNSLYWLTGGVPLEPGLVSAYGLYNLAAAPFILFGGITDANGEACTNINIPVTIPTGVDVATQVFVAVPGGYALSNPEVIRATL
jgi:hypothetical protein